MLAFVLASSLNASVVKANPAGSPCSITQEVVGTAPSDIVQKMFAQHFDAPLTRVDCRDNGLCYQKWGKDCKNSNL
jgi:hypothetical protein